MDKKIKIGIVIGIIVILAIIIIGIYLLKSNVFIRGQLGGFVRSLAPFSLNDSSARYYLEKKSSGSCLLLYTKGNNKKEIFVSKDTTLNLENYLDRPVKVNGKFIKEKEIGYCIKAPCPAIEKLVVHIDGIAFVNDQGQIKNPSGEIN